MNPFFQRNDNQERILDNASQLIGWTPLVETKRISSKEGVVARIVVKLESYQPGGSLKDRIALKMILDAESKGILKPGESTLVEPTSGNTGISLSLVALFRGYKVIALMPSSYSLERRMVLKSLGAEIIITDAAKGLEYMFNKAREMASTLPHAVMLDQAENPMNPGAHFESTGPEIWEDTRGQVDIFMAGCGTGGTLSGTGHYLKTKNPAVKVIAVEPSESPVLSGGEKGSHSIQGLGPGFIPPVTDTSIIDKVVSVSSQESYEYALRLMREEGLIVGISSGAAFGAAVKEGKLPENAGKMIVVILPSGGERYLSTSMFDSIKKECESLPVH